MRSARLEKLIWVLIFGGMLSSTLGLFLLRGDSALGWIVTLAGAVAVAAGVLLIVVRSRRPD